ncbi:MAG: methyltransferase domain-containing protein, partial [Phycisphaerales bacterium]
NVDVQRSPKATRDPEILAKATEIPLDDGVADEIMAIHLFEHFYYWEAPKALAEWRRLLKPGGLLVLEMPDVKKCAKNLVRLIETEDLKNIDSLAMHGLYGDPREEDPWMSHKWGWTPKTLRKLLRAHGFGSFTEPVPQWHAIGRKLRDFRLEARKV